MKYVTLPRALVVLALALSVAACKKSTTTTTTQSTAIKLGPESYALVKLGVIESGPVISGTLVPRSQATVRAQLSGSILRIYVDQGQYVKSGQAIAEIDPTALTDQSTSAQIAVTNAQAQLDLAQKEENRLEALAKAGAIAERDVEQAHKNVVNAEAGLSAARAQLASANKQLRNTTVRAPFSGMVSEKSVAMGDVVQPGTALYTIVDPSTLELQATIPADAIGMVHVGLPVKFSITGYPNQIFTGTVTRINPSADPSTRQIRIYAEIPNQGKTLVGGLYAEGRVGSVLKTAVSLPSDAIDRKMITTAVERVRGGIVERVPVTIGTTDDKLGVVQILSGVNPGDTVLRGSAKDIALGTKIQIISAPSAPSTANTR
jgi:membrane fusion protein (multidrug efflux system)